MGKLFSISFHTKYLSIQETYCWHEHINLVEFVYIHVLYPDPSAHTSVNLIRVQLPNPKFIRGFRLQLISSNRLL